MTPALKGKDIPPGPWVRRRSTPEHLRLCTTCGTRLHHLLPTTATTHPLCTKGRWP